MQRITPLAGIFAGAMLASVAQAQTPYGEWTHDMFDLRSVYVSPTGSNTNSGLDPANPVQTIDQALQVADSFLSILYPFDQKAATINLAPGTYSVNSSIDVPAYGISIEPMWSDDPSAQVVVDLVGGSGNVFQFTQPFGPLVQAAATTPDVFAKMPPSVLRGLRIEGDSVGTGVYINPTLNNPAEDLPSPCAVGIHQCEFVNLSTGISIEKDLRETQPYRNEIINNDIHVRYWGMQINGGNGMSDLIRSNRIYDCHVGMTVTNTLGPAPAGGMRPRILSNAFTNIGAHNLQPVGGLPVSSCIEFGDAVSGQIVGNTFAYTRHNCPNQNTCLPLPGYEPAAISYFGFAGLAGETLVIANNLFYNPSYATPSGPFNTLEISFLGGVFPGTLIIESNDYDNSGPLVSPALAVSPSNVAIGDPQFVNGTFGAYDVHLTAASQAVVNFGDRSFTEPSVNSTFTLGTNTFPANCALDFDLDSRTHQTGTSAGPVLFRGADQLVLDGVRLSAPTASAGVPANQLADRFGNISAQVGSATTIRLEVAAPVGSFYATMLCSTLPMGPEVQHVVIAPAGSLAIDPSPGSGLIIDSGLVTTGVATFDWNMGTLLPGFLEAEMYLQTMVLRPNGTQTFSNRIRLDVEQP